MKYDGREERGGEDESMRPAEATGGRGRRVGAGIGGCGAAAERGLGRASELLQAADPLCGPLRRGQEGLQ